MLATVQDVFLTFWVPPARGGGRRVSGWRNGDRGFIAGMDPNAVLDWAWLAITGTCLHIYDAQLVEVFPTTGG